MKKLFQSSKITNLPTSIFSTINKLANEHSAVNLGQGFPDFDGPVWLMEAAFNAMKTGKNQYAPSLGIHSLRKVISETYNKYYELEYNPETEITITAGATEALYSVITSLIETGDEVLMFEPFYDAHQADVILAGGKPVYVTLHKPDFNFDFDELEKAITNKTKMLILNTPHNPTGKVFSIEELQFIAKLAIEHDFLVVSDDVYEFLTYDDVKHIPISTLVGMKERTVIISSTGKTFGMTGWKVGYALAPEYLTNSIRKVHQWVTFAVNTPAQQAMAYGFLQLDTYLPEFKQLYQQKMDYVYTALIDSNFKPYKPNGSYFIMVELPENKFKDDTDAAMTLITKYKVATIPPSVFYGKSDEGKTMLRICFAKKQETLENGMKILKNL